MSRQWYVISVFTSQENKVYNFIRKKIDSGEWKDRVFDILLPEETVQKIRNGKKHTYKRRMFPGYLLIEMDFNEDNYKMVRQVPGVSGFVNYDGITPPPPLKLSEVQSLSSKITTEETKSEQNVVQSQFLFRLEDRVKIISGAFKDFIGVVEEVNPEKGRLKVRVEIFGRSTPVDVNSLEVEKVS